jgi:glycosyltransferase involved in cell wall biosynthesis
MFTESFLMEKSESRILFLDKSNIFSGAEFCLASLCKHLNGNDFNALICANFPADHLSGYKKCNCKLIYRNRRLRWWMGSDYSLRAPRGTDLLKRIVFAVQLALIIKKHRINICHINLLRNTDILDIRIAKLLGCSVIGHVRSLNSQVPIHVRTIKNCAKVICTSDYVMNDSMQESYSGKFVRVYDPIDICDYDSSKVDINKVRRKYNVCNDELILSSIALLDPRKGHDIAIRALVELQKNFKKIKLIIAGGNLGERSNEEKRLKELASDLKVIDKVVFTGFVKSIVELYAISDIVLALSSDGEAFGRVPLEAAAAKKVVIATNLGATPEIIIDKKTGFLVERNDYLQVAEIASKLLSEKDLIDEISGRAYNHVVKNFTSEHHVSKMERIYSSI